MCKTTVFFIYYMFIQVTHHNFATGQQGVELIKCHGFVDKRKSENAGALTFHIPANLSSRGVIEDEPLPFKLMDGRLSCDIKDATLHSINWKDGQIQSLPPTQTTWSRDFRDFNEDTRKFHPTHFTPDGFFFYGKENHFFHPNGSYCVKTLEDSKLDLLLCPPKCDPKTSICVPKCCALDEAIFRGECVKLSGEQQWKPEVFEGDQPIPKNDQRRFQFFQPDFPMSCNDEKDPFSKMFFSKADEEDQLRLDLNQKGYVEPTIYKKVKRGRHVEEFEVFCVEGLIKNGTLAEDDYVEIYCSPKSEENEMGKPRALTYIIFSFISVPFLIAIVVIYLILLPKLNLHSLTILGYSVSHLFTFSLLIGAQLIYVTDLPRKVDWVGVKSRGWFCYILATSAHFFSLSSYMWLTVMNFDLWMLFKSVRAAKKDSKELKKFGMYSVVGWLVPLVLVIVFIILDEVYRDPASGVPVPDYATLNCFISPEFRGYYVFMPIAIILAGNCIFIILTMRIFWMARRNEATFAGGNAKVNSSNKYSAKLFCKLFIVMGGVSLVDYVSWYYSEYQHKTPWPIVVLESCTYLVPVFLFGLFCLNDRVLGQLQEKFPGISDRLKPIKKILRLEKETVSTNTVESDCSTPTEKQKGIRLSEQSIGKYSSTTSSNF